MYQNYIFDFYGTLVDIRTNESKPYLWKKMSELYTALGAVYTASELRRNFRRLEKEAECAWDAENVEIDLTKVFAELYRVKGVTCDETQARMTAITFRTLSRKYIRVYDGVVELLTELRARGKGVYLLSNAQTNFTRPEIDTLGLTEYFDDIFISSEQGYKKPSTVFFREAVREVWA